MRLFERHRGIHRDGCGSGSAFSICNRENSCATRGSTRLDARSRKTAQSLHKCISAGIALKIFTCAGTHDRYDYRRICHCSCGKYGDLRHVCMNQFDRLHGPGNIPRSYVNHNHIGTGFLYTANGHVGGAAREAAVGDGYASKLRRLNALL